MVAGNHQMLDWMTSALAMRLGEPSLSKITVRTMLIAFVWYRVEIAPNTHSGIDRKIRPNLAGWFCRSGTNGSLKFEQGIGMFEPSFLSREQTSKNWQFTREKQFPSTWIDSLGPEIVISI